MTAQADNITTGNEMESNTNFHTEHSSSYQRQHCELNFTYSIIVEAVMMMKLKS